MNEWIEPLMSLRMLEMQRFLLLRLKTNRRNSTILPSCRWEVETQRKKTAPSQRTLGWNARRRTRPPPCGWEVETQRKKNSTIPVYARTGMEHKEARHASLPPKKKKNQRKELLLLLSATLFQ